MDNLKYPIGQFELPKNISLLDMATAMETIRRFPFHLESLLKDIEEADWKRSYRPGGWNVGQLVHHCADSHMNCFIRFKLALTEENPVVKPYKEKVWAEQEDYSVLQAWASVDISRGIHARWSILLEKMAETDWNRGFFHPEQNKTVPLTEAAMYYAWHCRHHLKHIEIALKKREGDEQ